MFHRIRKGVLAIAALAALAAGGSAVAGAASSNSGSTNSRQPPAAATGPQAVHPGETLLSDGTADKVKQAALGKVPGATVLRVETDAEGSPYEAHLRKSDGSLATVKVNKQFEATKVEQGFGAGGPGGRGAMPGGAAPGGAAAPAGAVDPTTPA